jgi:hypothetical protein
MVRLRPVRRAHAAVSVASSCPAVTVLAVASPAGCGSEAPAAVTPSLGRADEQRLQPLGNGWHAADTGYGSGGITSVTLRAYNSAGQLIGTVTEAITAPQPGVSQAPPTAAPPTPTH